jgi:leucyl/phenylalanyl-tRNA--protein transferase
MPIYQLHPKILQFPSPNEAESSGLLAMGGDLSSDRILMAYKEGIFPWYEEGQPLLWWSPDPRFVLFPEKIHITRSLAKVLRNRPHQVRYDTHFAEVIHQCAATRALEGTWITRAMKNAYIRLHEQGFAHSIEVWEEDELVGGLYGISLGHCFFGESMFSKTSNASKLALVSLSQFAMEQGLRLIDCQVRTDHLLRLGAEEMRRRDFLEMLQQELDYPTLRGPWISTQRNLHG